jgi:hypothetical protein
MSRQQTPIPTPTFGQGWTRLKNDREYIQTDLKQSIAPLEFALDPSYAERCEPCISMEGGWIGKQGVSYDASKPIIDTESDLFNLNRLLSKDPQFKYHPSCITKDCMGVMNGCDACQPKLYHFRECGNKNEYTRTSNPVSTMRETGVNRFQPICLNPQDPSRWEHPGEIGINYRMVVKDNHVPCIPHPIDQTPALPIGGKLPCTLIYPTCAAPIAALNNYRKVSEQMPLNVYTH